MKEMQGRAELELQLAVSGTHLLKDFGETCLHIEADGFRIDEKIDILEQSDDSAAATRSIAKAAFCFADTLKKLEPNAVMLLGDRYELLGFAAAALMARVPLLHIGGGDVTEGAMDDSVRHSLTKMSYLHFPSTEQSRQRIIQLGEDPARVFNVGAVGIDSFLEFPPLNRTELSDVLGFDLSGHFLLATYHPPTLSDAPVIAGIDALLSVLSEHAELKVVFTGVNADPGYMAIDSRIQRFASTRPQQVYFSASLGLRNYLSAMRLCRAVIGNSSSGIVEAPTAGVPTVNIGYRQRGRVRAASVIDCDEAAPSISTALKTALSDEFQQFAKTVDNPYGKGGSSRKIVDIVASALLTRARAKPFWDLPQS